jgi:hypothetical protein
MSQFFRNESPPNFEDYADCRPPVPPGGQEGNTEPGRHPLALFQYEHPPQGGNGFVRPVAPD